MRSDLSTSDVLQRTGRRGLSEQFVANLSVQFRTFFDVTQMKSVSSLTE